MKNLSFEVHRYAPELTKAYWHGIDLGIKIDYSSQLSGERKDLVRAVRNHSKFSKKSSNYRYAKIRKEYDGERHQWLNETLQGSFQNIASVTDIIDKYYSPESDIIDGTKLPEPRIYVAFGRKGKLKDITELARNRYNNGKSNKTKSL